MKALMLKVIERSLAGAEALPPAERADLYEGIAELIAGNASFDPLELVAAREAAAALREAEGKQLTFAALMRRPAPPPPLPVPHD